MKHSFPFTAILGQSSLKTALMLTAVDPLLQGVLISGPRGVAKSTTARAFFDVLPSSNKGAFVNVPLGVTDDRLIGSLDVDHLLGHQESTFKEGLLHHAHEGVLYVDEVNLLKDDLVDLLLDVAASGVNRVERDGLSHEHPSHFILIGTMNPEEGELRPQFLDRFGLSVELQTPVDIDERIAIVERREAFDHDPERFLGDYASSQQALTQQFVDASSRLHQVKLATEQKRRIAKHCIDAGVEGLRADIMLSRASKAYAALHERVVVTDEDIKSVLPFVLNHRRQPSSEPPKTPLAQPPFKRPPPRGVEQQQKDQVQGDHGMMEAPNQVVMSAEVCSVPESLVSQENQSRRLHKKQEPTPSINWFRSLIKGRGKLTQHSLVSHAKRQTQGTCHVVVMDTSSSMSKGQKASRMKKFALTLAEEAYRTKEYFALMSFGNGSADIHQPLKRAPVSLQALLDTLSHGGGTPMSLLLETLQQKLTQWMKRYNLAMTTYLITDGLVAKLPRVPQLPGTVVVIDAEENAVKRSQCPALAAQLQADYRQLGAYFS